MKKWERERNVAIYKAQGYSKKEIAEKLQADIVEEKEYRTACRNVGKTYEEEQQNIAMQELGMTLKGARRFRRTGKEPD